MVYPAYLQSPYIPQAMQVAPPNPYFSQANPAFNASLEANAPGITKLAAEAIKIQNEVTELNARLFQHPVQFTDEPYFAIIQLVQHWVPLYTNTLDTHTIAMTFFHQMFPSEQQVVDIANATLSDCPVLFSGQDHPVIAQLIPQLQVSFNPYHVLAPQAEPLLPNPAQAAQPSSTNHSSHAATLIHLQKQQCHKSAHTKPKSRRKRVSLGENLTLRAKQYISWFKRARPNQWSSSCDKWGFFIEAFSDLCKSYLDQVGRDINRLKSALSLLKFKNKNKEIEVPEELETIFAEITKKPLPNYSLENEELNTRVLQYINWLKREYPDSWSHSYNKWDPFIDYYLDLCTPYLEKVEWDRKKLKHALSCFKYDHKETEIEVPEEIKAEFKEIAKKALSIS